MNGMACGVTVTAEHVLAMEQIERRCINPSRSQLPR